MSPLPPLLPLSIHLSLLFCPKAGDREITAQLDTNVTTAAEVGNNHFADFSQQTWSAIIRKVSTINNENRPPPPLHLWPELASEIERCLSVMTAMRQIGEPAVISGDDRMAAAKNMGATRLSGCEHFSEAIRVIVRDDTHATTVAPPGFWRSFWIGKRMHQENESESM